MWRRRVDTSEAHAERALLREQLDRAYDVLKLKRTEERNMVQDVAQVRLPLCLPHTPLHCCFWTHSAFVATNLSIRPSVCLSQRSAVCKSLR